MTHGSHPIVVKVSGKLVEDPECFKSIASALKEALGYTRLVVVVGGGRLARKGISLLAELGVSKALQDIIGIQATRFYARLLALALGSMLEPPRSFEEFLRVWAQGHNPIVMGGLQPGQSTTTVAALVAEAIGAKRIVIASIVDGVFDKDPLRHPDAKLIPRLSAEEALKVISMSVEPGRYELVDPYAVAIMRRSRIEAYVVNGRFKDRVVEAIKGGTPLGTLITPG